MKNFLIIENSSKFSTLNENRYNRDAKQTESYLKLKEDNHKKILDGRGAADTDFMGRKDLQDQITKMKEHLENIEVNQVELQHLSV